MQSHNPRTIAEAIDACRQRPAPVSRTPWLDARLLAQHVTGLDASAVIAYGDASIDARRKTRLFELVERRASGEPVAYITGHKSFCGLDIACDRRALVPRPETEELVMACVDDWADGAPAIADMGTGSGAIACALAHFLPRATIVASDINADALELAAYNAQRLGFTEQIQIVRSDLFTEFPTDRRFDVIIANLPYVALDTVDMLEQGVRAHEPSNALVGGQDGLDVYRRLVVEVRDRLQKDGALYFECAPSNAAALQQLVAKQLPEFAPVTRKDLAGLDRMVIAKRLS